MATQPIVISITANSRDAVNGLQTTGQAADDMGKKLGHAALAVAGLVAGFAAVKVGSFVKDAIGQASDLNETMSKTNFLFGKGANAIQDWSKNAATSLGLTRKEALDAAGNFAVFGNAAGLTGDKLVAFGKTNTQLAGDLASFFNTTASDAADAISAAMRGETDPIRRYGVMIDDLSLRQQAFKMGIVKTTKDALTPQARVLAAQALIMQETTAAQGDLARTSGGLANQQRILSAQFGDFKATIGTALLPVVISFVQALNDKLMPALNQLWATHGPAVTAFLQKMADQLGKLDWDKVLSGVGGAIDSAMSALKDFNVGDALTKIGDGLAKVAPQLGELKANAGPDLADDLKVFGTIMQFAADHVDLLAKALPFLAAGYIAVKTAQATANVAATVGPVLRIAEMIANRRLAASNLELIATMRAQAAASKTSAVSSEADTAATNTGILARGRAVVSMVAQKVASVATSAATKAAAAAQWLWNAALDANPIGLIIIGVLLLVAGIILLWKHSETFRTIVLATWSAIQVAAKAVADWFMTDLVPVFKVIWDFIVFAFQAGVALVKVEWAGLMWLKDKAVEVFNAVMSVVDAVVGWIAARIADAVAGAKLVWAGITWLADKAASVVDSIIAVIGTVAGWVKQKITDAVVGAKLIWQGILSLADTVVDLKNRILGVFTGAVNWLKDTGSDIVNGLIDGIRNGWGRVTSFLHDQAKKLPSWITGPLGISSPSRVMAGVGAEITNGLAAGIAGQVPQLQRTLDRVSGVVENGISASPTVDLTAAGARLAGAGNTVNITVQVPPTADPAEVGRQTVKAIQAWESTTGRSVLLAAA